MFDDIGGVYLLYIEIYKNDIFIVYNVLWLLGDLFEFGDVFEGILRIGCYVECNWDFVE